MAEYPIMADEQTDPWLAFGRIFCISLRNRSDRKAHAESEFRRVALADRVEFMLVDKHPTNSEQGIFESHIACLRAGLDAGAECITVFEDDIVFRRFSLHRLSQAAAFVRQNTDWR